MKRNIFLIMSLLAGAAPLVLWSMDNPPDETIFPLTNKPYGAQGWQKLDLDARGEQFDPPPVLDPNQEVFRRAINTFQGDVEKLTREIGSFKLDTAWYLYKPQRDSIWYYYPLQLILEQSISKDNYKTTIFRILIDMGAPIQNIKGYCPFRHLLNLIIKTNKSDQRERYRRCIDILITQGFNFDIPLAKNDGLYDGSDVRDKDLIDADASATGRVCIAKAIEYCDHNNLYMALDLFKEIKTKIDAIPVASLVEKTTVPVIEKKESNEELPSLSRTESLKVRESATPSAVTTGMSSLFPYTVVPLKKDTEPTIQPSTGSSPSPSSTSTPSISSPNPSKVVTLADQIQYKPSSKSTGPPTIASKPVSSAASPGSPTAPLLSSNNRLWEWCNTVQSTTLKKSLCVLAVGSAAMLAATKLWWGSQSAGDNDIPFSITFENKTESDLVIHTDESVHNPLPSNQSQTLDVRAISKITITSSANDTSTGMNIPLWLYKRYRASGTLHITITPETWAFKRWWFGTRYTYTARWQ